MTDNRDKQPPRKTPPTGVQQQIAKPFPPPRDQFNDDDKTPVEGGPLVIFNHRLNKVEVGQTRLEQRLDAANDRADGTNERIDGVIKEVGGLTKEMGNLTGAVGAVSGQMAILIQDRSHVKEIEKIDRITESRIAIVETRTELEDKNDKRSAGRKLWLTIVKLLGGAAVGVITTLGSMHC